MELYFLPNSQVKAILLLWQILTNANILISRLVKKISNNWIWIASLGGKKIGAAQLSARNKDDWGYKEWRTHWRGPRGARISSDNNI